MELLLIDVIILLVIVPQSMSPLAQALGKNSLFWICCANIVCFTVQSVVLMAYGSFQILGSTFPGWIDLFASHPMVPPIGLVAVVSGLMGVEATRRYFCHMDTGFTAPPPPPANF